MLMGFYIPIKFSTSEISNNRFLKSTIGTFTLDFLNISITSKLTCTHIAHGSRKILLKQNVFMFPNERKTQNQK
jgi:hypothetical protein